MTDLALLGLSSMSVLAMFLIIRGDEDEPGETSEGIDVDAVVRGFSGAKPRWVAPALL